MRIYGNLPIEIENEFQDYKNYVIENNKFNLLDNFKLNYNEKNFNDIENVLNIMNQYSIEDRINIAKKYDDILYHFLERYFSLKSFDINEYNKIIEETKHIRKIINYYVLKYKLLYNAPRPYQISSIYNIKLNPVNLLSANTPSFPSGHSALYYAYFLYFIKIDPGKLLLL